MSLDGTYAGLQTSVGDFLNRADLYASVPDFITLAAAQMNRRIRCAEMITSTTLTVSTLAAALPADFNGMVAFELPSGSGNPLRYVKPEEVRSLRQGIYASAGTPVVWSIAGFNVETAPVPATSFICPMLYYARLPVLSASVTTNWLLTKHPDAYLYGALMQSAPYLKDDARIEAWGKLYEEALTAVVVNDGRVSFGHGLLAPVRGAAAPVGNEPQGAPAPPPGPPQ
jgi:hypothetical protein